MKKSQSNFEIRKKAAEYLLTYCGNLKPKEKLLIIFDDTTKELIPFLEAPALKITKCIKKN